MLKKISQWLDKANSERDNAVSFLDSLDLEQAITTFESFQKLCWIAPITLWGIHLLLLIFPIINTLNFQFLLLLLFLVLVLNLVASFSINRYLFYFYSRNPKLDPNEKVEKLWSIQKISDWQTSITQGAIVALPFTFTVLPYIEFLRLHPTVAGWTVAMTDQLNGDPYFLRIFIMSIPVIATVFLYQRIRQQERMQEANITDWMSTFQYHKKELHSMLSGVPKREETIVSPDPYMVIGTSINSGDTIELAPVNRKQNGIYFGPVGAGKTSTIFKPQIKQDIDYYLRFIRDYPKISKDPAFMKVKGNVATHYLNGFGVIETSNDLCAAIYDMAVKMGVPKEKIVWLDPSNPETPSLNLLRGPVDTVVETVTNIIAGVKADNQDFFKQSERSHLKNFIFLLKLSCVVENKIATFPDLMDLYNDIYKVVDRMKVLDQYVEALNAKLDEAKEAYEQDKSNKKLKTRYQELFDKYSVAYGTSAWFHTYITPATFGQGVLKQKAGPHEGEVMWIDKQADNVQGLKNSLDDLSKNKYLRRVLFRDSGDFNLDDLLANGGILLCNTAKAELQDQLAGRLGQIYLMSLQAATFRRQPDKVPLFALYADEFPDFVSEAFKSFIAQARKYSVCTVVAAQSPSQLSYNFGPDFFNTLMTNMLTRGTFGDLGAEDATLLEKYFGEHTEVEESLNEQQIDLTADQDNNRRMLSARRQKVPNISADQIMSLPKFTIAVRYPGPQGSNMFDMIKTHYLTDEDILHDPNVFDIHDPKDHNAYETMVANAQHTNSDFDDVDLEIIDDIDSGRITFGKVIGKSSPTKTAGSDADDDLRKPPKINHDKDEKPSEAENETNSDTSKGDSDKSQISESESFFTDFEDNDSSDLVTNDDLDDKEIAKKKAEAQKIASEAVHKTINHGGNNRFDNGVQTDDKLPDIKIDSSDRDKKEKYETEEKNKEPEIKKPTDSVKKPENNSKEKEDNMLIVKDDKLLETKKDRDSMDNRHRENDKDYLKMLKHQILNDLSKNLKEIAKDSSLTNAEKVKQLTDMRDKERSNVYIVCDKSTADKVFAKINKSINKFKAKEQTAPSPISKDDDLESMMQKSREVGSNKELSDELSKMLDQFDDDADFGADSTNSNAFDNSDDDFMNQHGMDDE